MTAPKATEAKVENAYIDLTAGSREVLLLYPRTVALRAFHAAQEAMAAVLRESARRQLWGLLGWRRAA